MCTPCGLKLATVGKLPAAGKLLRFKPPPRVGYTPWLVLLPRFTLLPRFMLLPGTMLLPRFRPLPGFMLLLSGLLQRPTMCTLVPPWAWP